MVFLTVLKVQVNESLIRLPGVSILGFAILLYFVDFGKIYSKLSFEKKLNARCRER